MEKMAEMVEAIEDAHSHCPTDWPKEHYHSDVCHFVGLHCTAHWDYMNLVVHSIHLGSYTARHKLVQCGSSLDSFVEVGKEQAVL